MARRSISCACCQEFYSFNGVKMETTITPVGRNKRSIVSLMAGIILGVLGFMPIIFTLFSWW
jgi:hypothetical protein